MFINITAGSFSKSREGFLLTRQNNAQILFNKVSLYLKNAVSRKTSLMVMGKEVLSKMKANDIKIIEEINKLKKVRNENSELAITLNMENELINKKLKKCEMITSINSKCEELSKIYKSVLSAYEKQSSSLEKIYRILIKQNN